MMTDVVLIEPPYYRREKKAREQPQLGLAYIAGYLEEQDVQIRIIDAALNDLSPQQIAEQVKVLNPFVIGITGCTEDRFGMIKTIQIVRNKCKDALIVGGGPHFSCTAEDALINIPALDVVVVGEGEYTMAELVHEFSSNRKHADFKQIKGIVYRQDANHIIRTALREPIRDLNTLPSPAWHLFEMDRYQGTMSANAPYRAIGVISSRGCPYSCIYCANSLKKVRYLAPSRFVDELEHLRDTYGFQAFNFQDDSFTINRKHVKEICNEILSRQMNIKWYCSLRVDRADKDLLQLMKEAGCVALGFGIEFPSDDVLKRIKKIITVQMIENALQNVAEVGFPYIRMFLMNSLPGQSRINTIRAQLNINRFHEILYGNYPYSIFKGGLTTLYPGTEITRLAEEQSNVFPPDFSWNRYYKNPHSVELFNEWRIGSWSTSNYENENFSLQEIKQTLQETESYLYIQKIRYYKSIWGLFRILINPRRWKMFRDATSVWLTLKHQGLESINLTAKKKVKCQN